MMRTAYDRILQAARRFESLYRNMNAAPVNYVLYGLAAKVQANEIDVNDMPLEDDGSDLHAVISYFEGKHRIDVINRARELAGWPVLQVFHNGLKVPSCEARFNEGGVR